MDKLIYVNDLAPRLKKHRSLIDQAIERVLNSGYVILGPELLNFESSFAKYIGVNHCVGVANGTDAIELGLKAIGVQEGNVVATIANGGMYTSTALKSIGAHPFFLDVDIKTNNTYLSEIRRAIENGVDAIVLTHLFGRAVEDTPAIYNLCLQHDVLLFEDCAQAHGAIIGGKKAGSYGQASSFSFYPTKNLGALGDGGAVLTQSSEIAEKIFSLRQYGWSSKYKVSQHGGRNSRLDELQASILSAFLPYLDQDNLARQSIAQKYSKLINHQDIEVPPEGGDSFVAHLYVIKTKSRPSLLKHLKSFNIISDIHYPIPDHKQSILEQRFLSTSLPVTELLADQILTLPCHPYMTDPMIELVISAVNSWKS